MEGGGTEAGVAADEEDIATRAAVAAKVCPQVVCVCDA